MIEFAALLDVAAKLDVIQAVKGKLLKQPDPAADKLVAALGEIYKIFGAVDAELAQYLALFFDPQDPAAVADERARLLALEGGEVRARMAMARGHCSKIGNIYRRYLSPWFDRLLPGPEVQVLAELFQSLDQFDGQMVLAIDKLADWLTKEAGEVLDLVDAGQLDDANQRVRAARKEVQPQRRAVSDAMRTLLGLQSEFIEISGAV